MKAPKHPARKQGSSVIAHHYDAKAGHLTVTYHGGRKYRYFGVDPQTAAGLAKAMSKGSFLHSSVIGKFRHSKLDN